MGLLDVASALSAWRGLKYYEAKKVLSLVITGEGVYTGKVVGDCGEQYCVCIDTNHARKSTCDCPFATGKRVVCKHMIALYFASTPDAAREYSESLDSGTRRYLSNRC